VNDETKDEQVKFRISASMKQRILEAKDVPGFREMSLMEFTRHLLELGLELKEEDDIYLKRGLQQKGEGEAKDQVT